MMPVLPIMMTRTKMIYIIHRSLHIMTIAVFGKLTVYGLSTFFDLGHSSF